MKNVIYLIVLLAVECQKPIPQEQSTSKSIEHAMIMEMYDLDFSDAQIDSMNEGIINDLESFKALRTVSLENSTAPTLIFNPLPDGVTPNTRQRPIAWGIRSRKVSMPENKEELAFYSVADLAVLIYQRKITSLELTNIYLDRINKHADTLQCVITLTEDLAMQQAQRADDELSRGIYHGPLHGIPYGLKDLFAVPGYKTTWGAMPFKDQVIDETATVAQKLEEAGAVLIAKLTLGALAWGDVWYGGVTKNPWNLEQGSSGSSAGSASATSAGLVAFAIGTETWGSIVSPSTRCGVTGLRPTFGRVSRHGAMALCWSMDKVGPICRNAFDCALVLEAIQGEDKKDPATIEAAFNFNPKTDVAKLKVAYLSNLFEEEYNNKSNDSLSLLLLKELGIEPVPISWEFDQPINPLSIILTAEASAAFDELTRSKRDSLMVRQINNAWPNVFRTARFIPAVEYLMANRQRRLLINAMHELFSEYDVIISPSFGGDQLLATNLSGHPCVVIPNGTDENGSPTSISLLANFFEEDKALSLADALQEKMDSKHPVPPYFQVK